MADLAKCARCGAAFVARRTDHRFCSPQCRHAGERKPHDLPAVDPQTIERLFADDRDIGAPARPDDWHPGPAEFAALDTSDTVRTRRKWYVELLDRGLL